MKKQIMSAVFVALIASPLAVPSTVLAAPSHRYDYRWNGDRNTGWDPARHYHRGHYRERRMTRRDRIYRGGDGRYYCRRSDGTTGLVVGAIAGGLLGNAIGGDALSTLLGAGGGAALGHAIDSGNVRCR